MIVNEQTVEQKPEQEAPSMAAANDNPVKIMRKWRGIRNSAYQAAYRKAKRRGLPIPPLPAGERWKRRLPVICW